MSTELESHERQLLLSMAEDPDQPLRTSLMGGVAVHSLSDQGLVARVTGSPEDRQAFWRLTDAGRALAKELSP